MKPSENMVLVNILFAAIDEFLAVAVPEHSNLLLGAAFVCLMAALLNLVALKRQEGDKRV